MSMSYSLEPVTVPLHGERDFADVIIRTLRWGSYPGLSRWAHAITRVLKYTRGRQERESWRKRWEVRSRGWSDVIAGRGP